jgi:pSer/pThr/pTyr-binding forkhead associated (FHA) protein/ribosomal protein L40E
MSICPNCNHSNPAGATQCEACFTPLPATASCPSCGAVVQLDATFCGQCGTNLKPAGGAPPVGASPIPQAVPVGSESALPATIIAGVPSTPAPVVVEPVVSATPTPVPVSIPETPAPVVPEPVAVVPETPVVEPILEIEPDPILPTPIMASQPSAGTAAAPAQGNSSTQLQQQGFQLSHIQSGTIIDIPNNVTVIHIGKPNEQIPPDIDVSGFPCAEVVSRVHADLRIEGDSVYIEDTGSANGTFVNHNVLPKGNRHLLRVGDRISLGKGDLVTFLFHTS